MFKDHLAAIVEQTEGGLAGLIMDASGIPLESYAKSDAPFEIDAVGVEFGVLLGAIKRAAKMLDAGETREVSFGADRFTTVIRTLNEQYFLALAIKPEGNLGKGRYLMRVAAPKIQQEL
jgi:predicted regulator of Ras-like GTPase activity (Roadblock/LC7/MglB family)